MEKAETVISYLTETYRPNAVILYGSFADGSANENSDFDALVITDHIKKHDTSTIGNTKLDVFLYPQDTFQSEYDPEAFIQILDGKIILDEYGIAERLLRQVTDYVEHKPKKTEEEIRQELDWCEKMLSRTMREDAEGFYRWHWVLVDSLEIYADIKRLYYCGPKKTLRRMERSDQEAFRRYSQALKTLDRAYLSEWIDYLKRLSAVA